MITLGVKCGQLRWGCMDQWYQAYRKPDAVDANFAEHLRKLGDLKVQFSLEETLWNKQFLREAG